MQMETRRTWRHWPTKHLFQRRRRGGHALVGAIADVPDDSSIVGDFEAEEPAADDREAGGNGDDGAAEDGGVGDEVVGDGPGGAGAAAIDFPASILGQQLRKVKGRTGGG